MRTIFDETLRVTQDILFGLSFRVTLNNYKFLISQIKVLTMKKRVC